MEQRGVATVSGRLSVRRVADQPDASLAAAERRVAERGRNVGAGGHYTADSLHRQVGLRDEL